MKIAGLYLALASTVPYHPDDVEEPFSAVFRTLLPKLNCRFGLAIVEPLIGLDTWVK